MELSRTSKEIVSEALGELGIPEINEITMPKSTDMNAIMSDLGPRFAKAQNMSKADYDMFKEFVKAVYDGDTNKAKKIEANYEFVSYLMNDIQDRKVPKFPLSFFQMFGGSQLANDAKKMKVTESINEVKMPKSTAFYFILKDLGPRFAKSQKMSDEEYGIFKDFVKAVYSGDKKKAKQIDDNHEFVSYIMNDTMDRRIPKFPLSFFELFGGSALADEVKKMKVASENL